MTATTIRSFLGLLQDEPDDDAVWSQLRSDVASTSLRTGKADELGEDALAELLAAARYAHSARGEYEAVERLLAIEAAFAKRWGGEREAELVAELASLRDDVLLDDAGALEAYKRLVVLRPDDTNAADVLGRAHAKRGKWKDLAMRYFTEAKASSDASFKSSLLVSAAETAYRYGLSELTSKEAKARESRDSTRNLGAVVPPPKSSRSLKKSKKQKAAAKASPDSEPSLPAQPAPASRARVELCGKVLALLRDASSFDPKNRRALLLNERLLRAEDKWEDVVRVLETFAEASTQVDDKVAALQRAARVLEKKLGSNDRAMSAYQRVFALSADPPREAMSALVHHFTDAARWSDLVALYETQLAREGFEPAEADGMVLQIAMVHWKMRADPAAAKPYFERLRKAQPAHPGMLSFFLEQGLDSGSSEPDLTRELEAARGFLRGSQQPLEALAAVVRASAVSASDVRVIELARELLAVAETRAKAAALLDEAYSENLDWQKQSEILAVRIATTASKADRLALELRLLNAKEKLGDVDASFELLARMVQDHPSEAELWERLGTLAQQTQRTRDYVESLTQAVPDAGPSGLSTAAEREVSERAALVFEELGDEDRAAPYWDRILRIDPAHEGAFARLKQILTTRENWNELEKLYEHVLGGIEDPRRNVELLSEVAIVAEDIRGDSKRAIGYQERVLALEPLHDEALRSLDRLYVSEARWFDLAPLLRRRLSVAGPHDAPALKVRLGTLLMTQFGDAKGALEAFDDLPLADASNAGACEVVERCLAHPEERLRAAVMLEAVYAEHEEMSALVRILEVRLEFVSDDDSERPALLRRIAHIRDERLKDESGAFEAYARLLPLASSDLDVRARFLALAERLVRIENATDVLLTAAARAEAPQPRAELLFEVAAIYAANTTSDRAQAIYIQILRLAPEDPAVALPALRALERIYLACGKSRDLAEVLAAHAPLEDEASVRRVLYGQLAAVLENELDDNAGAIAAWNTALELNPADDEALTALDRLYVRTSDHSALVEVLRARERHSGGTDESRKTYMLRAARLLAGSLDDVPAAILAYRAVLDDFGAEEATLGELARLFERAEQWSDLAETLEAELSLTTTDAHRVVVLTRLGDVRRTLLQDVREAVEAYRSALELDASNRASRLALEELLDDAAVRADVAEILRPICDAVGDFDALVRVLEIQIDNASLADDRLELYARAVEVTEGPLGNPEKAFTLASGALRDAAGGPSLNVWLARVERLAERTQAYGLLVALFRDVREDVQEPDACASLTLRIAELAWTKLDDRLLAKQYFERRLEAAEDDARALLALEQLYEADNEHESLVDILRRRASLANAEETKSALFRKIALVCEVSLGDTDRAIAAYEEMLQSGFDDEQGSEVAAAAATELHRLYATTARWGDLVALYERELVATTLTSSQRATLHQRLGSVHCTELADETRAFESYAEALREEPFHEATLGDLEALMRKPAPSLHAAETLESVYCARLEWARVVHCLEVRIQGTEDALDRRSLLRRLAKVHEDQEGNVAASLEVTARLLAEDPTERSTLEELERLARLANAEARLAEIYASELEKVTSDDPGTALLSFRTGELFEAQRESARALDFYRRAYMFAPEDQRASFEAIDRLLEQGCLAAERATIHRESLAFSTGLEATLATHHLLAKIEEHDLADVDAAVATFQSILDADETDARALDALARLYAQREHFGELASVYRRRAEQGGPPEEEARWRLSLGSLLSAKLKDYDGSIDEFEAVARLVMPAADTPTEVVSETWRSAVTELEALATVPEAQPQKARVVDCLRFLYEQRDDWAQTLSLVPARLALASRVSEKVAVLREAARLHETRGNDTKNAFVCARAAFGLDPEDFELRALLERLAAATERWDELADAYEEACTSASEVPRRELLEALAVLHDERRDDPRGSLRVWERLAKLDPTSVRPLDEIEKLATLLSDWSTVVRVLVARTELVHDGEERAALWRRIGESRRDLLNDVPGAIEAYECALELEPESEFALESLTALCAAVDPARYVTFCERRIALCGAGSEDLKHRLMLDVAKAYDAGLGNRPAAIGAAQKALAAKPSDIETLAHLDVLYTDEKMWPELLVTLRQRAHVESELSARAVFILRAGQLLATELGAFDEALTAFEEVLAQGYDEDAARGVYELGDLHSDLTSRAADTLETGARAAGAYARVANALELRLRTQAEVSDRVLTLRRLAEVYEGPLKDAERAAATLLRALAEDPDVDDLHAETARLSAQLGMPAWERYADVLRGLASECADASVAATRLMRHGTIAEEQLGDLPRAVEAYERAASRTRDSFEILVALERVTQKVGDAGSLARVLERRVAITTEPARRAELYVRLADLHSGPLNDSATALAKLRLALDSVPNHVESCVALETLLTDDACFDEAFEILDSVYRATSRGADLSRLYARRFERATGVEARTQARLGLARVLEESCLDAAAAQRVIEAAVVEGLAEASSLGELARLAEKTGGWSQATDALALALSALTSLETEPSSVALPVVSGSVRGELWGRLGFWRRDRIADPRGAEVAFARALELDAENVEFLRAREGMTREPGRERDRVGSLRLLARLEPAFATRQDFAREAAGLAETVVLDRQLAAETLREWLADFRHRGDAWASGELIRLRESEGDHEEVIRVLLTRAEVECERDRATAKELRHRAAVVLSDSLGDRERASRLYEEILVHDPDDVQAQVRLRALFRVLEKHGELATLLGTLIHRATSSEAKSELRMDLAQLQLEAFASPSASSETLRAILTGDPDHDQAGILLAANYEKEEQFRELADLLGQRATRAGVRGHTEREIDLKLRFAEVLEAHVGDAGAALTAYRNVLSLAPLNEAALSAVSRLAEARGEWELAATALRTWFDVARVDERTRAGEVVALALRFADVCPRSGSDVGVDAVLMLALDAHPDHPEVRARLAAAYEATEKWAELALLLVAHADALRRENPYEPPSVVPAPAGVGARSVPPRGSVPPGSMAPSAAPGPAVPAFVTEEAGLLHRAAHLYLAELQSPELAMTLLERAARLMPHDREGLLRLADAYVAARRHREAAGVLERVIASFGNRRTKDVAPHYHRLGLMLAALGDNEAALVQLDAAFRVDPGAIEVLKDLGMIAFAANDFERAQKTFRALLLQRLDASRVILKGEVFCFLGEISMKQGETAKAIQMLERAVDSETSPAALARARALLQDLKA